MTGSVSNPRILIYDSQDETRYWDVSGIVTSINIGYGRNQPFAVCEFVVKKAYFNSLQGYWDEIDTTPTDGQGNKELPSPYLVDGATPVLIESYGSQYEMFVERHEQRAGDDYITFLCYNKAYKLKTSITMSSLASFVMYNGKVYFAYDVGHNNPLTAYDASDTTHSSPISTITTQGKYDAVCILENPDSVTFRVNITADNVTSGGVVLAEYMQGNGSNIFRFVQMYGAGFSYADCICDNGYTYDYGQNIERTYTSAQIEAFKNAQVIEGDGTEVIKLRVNEDSRTCWDILKSIGALSNRWPFFYDYAYFADYNVNSITTLSHAQKLYEMKLDYGLNQNAEFLSYTKQSQDQDKVPLELYEIVSNADQGSTYVQTSQKVFAEGYSTMVSVSDIPNNNVGQELYFPYPECDPTDVSLIDNSARNMLQKTIAFNRVVSNYKPSDAIQFKISELSGQEDQIDVIGTYQSVDDLPATADEGDYALVIEQTVLLTYYQYLSGSWVVDESAFSMNDRNQRFSPYCIIQTVEDKQNAIKINNAPLAYVQLMWPSCLTQVTFGNPEFMDAQQQWSFLSLEAQVSTEHGTEDSMISDRYASKLVIGNQTMQQLDDNRAGFTGLIMEKNWDNDLYRLAGYKNGVVQAYFNSEGEIMSGNEKVTINQNGITIDAGGGSIDPSILPESGIPEWNDTKQYAVGDIVQWDGKIYTALIANVAVEPGTSGTNKTWEPTGNVYLWSSLDIYAVGDIVIYNGKVYTCNVQTGNTNVPGDGHIDPTTQEPYWICLVSTSDLDGNIIAQNNNIYSTQSGGRTKIDSEGLKTYNSSGNLVCSVGTDGNINGIKINASQITAGEIDASQITVSNINGSNITSGTISASRIDTANMSIGGSAQSATYATSQGSALVNQWSTGTSYVVGDTVTYTNSTDTSGLTLYFRCKSQHTQTNSRRPKGGTYSSTYWEEISQANSQGTTTPHVVIDSTGLKTYGSTSTVQCYVGTDGSFYAGSNQVNLGYDGIHIKDYTYPNTNAGLTFDNAVDASYPVLFQYFSSAGIASYSGLFEISGAKRYGFLTRGAGNSFLLSSDVKSDIYVSSPESQTVNVVDPVARSFKSTETFSSSKVGKIWYASGLIIYFGYNSSSTATTTSVSFQTTSELQSSSYGFSSASKVIYAQCSSIRASSGQDGNDYVSNITATGMDCRHESGGGFYWIAIGY